MKEFLRVPILLGLGIVLHGSFELTAGKVLPASAILKTPENRSLSPLTGYTREHWLEICERLIAGVLPYFDQRTGMPVFRSSSGETGHFATIAGPVVEQKMGFERSLMLVACYTAATGLDRVSGYAGSITAPYLETILHGTNPQDPRYWGERKIYEAFGTNIALAVLLSPKFFWDPLTTRQKKNLLDFLQGLARTAAYDCNHWYFHLAAVPLLDHNQVWSNREYLTQVFERLLNWYRGDGWFIDGGNLAFDYYNLWGFQLYNNALLFFDRPWKEKFGERVRHTTARFLETFPYLFGRDGGPIPFGRSVTYRFAGLSALGWAVLNKTNTLPPGEARRIASGCLKYFWEQGCLSENGLLEVGFYGPNTVAAESYMDRGTPYWAAQAMICLAIPADHPFWTSREGPMPADETGGRLALPGAEMVLKVSPIDGEAKSYLVGAPIGHAGQWQRGIKYFQHAYSSYLGWCALGEQGPDLGAGRTGASHDGRNWYYRTNPRPVQVDSYHSVSVYDIAFDTPEKEFEEFGQVITHTLIGETGEVHVFWHNSARPLHLWLGGYGISVSAEEVLKESRNENSINIGAPPFYSILRMLTGPQGKFRVEHLEPRKGWRHAHLFGGLGAFPYWTSDSPVPPNRPVVAWVAGTRDRPPSVSLIRVEEAPGCLKINFEGKVAEVRVPY